MPIVAEKLFYTLAGFVLLTALFVLHPTNQSEVANLQNQMSSQFAVAWQQTIGDQPYFDDVALVFDSIERFYGQAGDATIALFDHGVADRDLAFIFTNVYQDFGAAIAHLPKNGDKTTAIASLSPNFMSEPAIYNIVPVLAPTAVVSGASIEPVNKTNSWVTIRDNFTGQLYCLAIYNNNINKYLGACKNDEYH